MISANELNQLIKLKTRLGLKNESEHDEILIDFLESAKSEIMARRHPYGNIPDTLDPRYSDLQIRMATVMFNKMGAEGQTSHSENGVSRSYEDYDFLLKEVVPLVGGIR